MVSARQFVKIDSDHSTSCSIRSQQSISDKTTLAIADAKGGVQIHAMDVEFVSRSVKLDAMM